MVEEVQSAKCKMQNAKSKMQSAKWLSALPGRPRHIMPICILHFAFCTLQFFCPSANATPTQEEVFRSINSEMSQKTDFSKLIPWGCAIAGGVVLLVLFNRREKRQVVPKAKNHQGKLLRQMARELHIKKAHIKQLKALAEETKCNSVLTLLLCPSVLNRAAQSSKVKIDRRAMAEIAQRFSARSATRAA
jgi:hypothetical protein